MDEGDLPAGDHSLEETALKLFRVSMMAFMADGAKAASIAVRESDKDKFIQWLDGRYASSKEVAMTGTTPAKMTKALKEDLEAQGMQTIDDLAFLELTRYLGRPVGSSERKGFAHNSPAHMMEGAKTAKKHGATNFDVVVKEAKVSRDCSAIDSWITHLAERCSSSEASPYAEKSGARIQASMVAQGVPYQGPGCTALVHRAVPGRPRWAGYSGGVRSGADRPCSWTQWRRCDEA